MSHNNISTSRLLSFGRHDSLRVLYLDDNKRREEENVELSEFCGSTRELQELYLRRSGISRFSVALTTFAPRLRRLHLDGNQIESLAFMANLPHTLAHLHMDDNRISRIEEGHFKNLVELSISGNQITGLCR